MITATVQRHCYHGLGATEAASLSLSFGDCDVTLSIGRDLPWFAVIDRGDTSAVKSLDLQR
jgi:hypothetical protein